MGGLLKIIGMEKRVLPLEDGKLLMGRLQLSRWVSVIQKRFYYQIQCFICQKHQGKLHLCVLKLKIPVLMKNHFALCAIRLIPNL